MNACSALLLTSALAAPLPDRFRDDRQALQGEWQVVEVIQLGQPTKTGETAFVFAGDGATSRMGGGAQGIEYGIRLGPGARPKTIDFTHQGTVSAVGVYELSGDSLKFCVRYPNDPVGRPQALEAREPGATLYVLTRVKK
jgi:uncharacterized protein (TIGR03067 family)